MVADSIRKFPLLRLHAELPRPSGIVDRDHKPGLRHRNARKLLQSADSILLAEVLQHAQSGDSVKCSIGKTQLRKIGDDKLSRAASELGHLEPFRAEVRAHHRDALAVEKSHEAAGGAAGIANQPATAQFRRGGLIVAANEPLSARPGLMSVVFIDLASARPAARRTVR